MFKNFISKRAVLLIFMFCLQLIITNSQVVAEESYPRDPFYKEGNNYQENYLLDTPNEYINPYTGDLSLIYTDISLPGNAGLDLKICRTYNSRNWLIDIIGSTRSYLAYSIGERSCLGFGWNMHMGLVIDPFGSGEINSTNPENPTLVLPDGSRHIFYYKDTVNGNRRMISSDFWLYEIIGSSDPTEESGEWKITSSNGTVYNMKYNESDPIGYNFLKYEGAGWVIDVKRKAAQCTNIQDTNGNSIKITYKNVSTEYWNIPRIDTITDSCARNVVFDYYDSAPKKGLLKSITVNEQKYEYSYDIKGGGVFKLLTVVTPPVGDSWAYNYYEDTSTTDYGTIGDDYLLKTATYPTGAVITYTYKNQPFSSAKIRRATPVNNGYFYYIEDYMRVLDKKELSGRAMPGTSVRWQYSYNPAKPEGQLTFDQPDVTTITYPNGKVEEISFYGWGMTDPQSKSEGSLVYQEISTLWKLGLMLDRKVKDSAGNILETENNKWQQSNAISAQCETFRVASIRQLSIYAPFLNEEKIARNVKTYTTKYTYDTYGNPTKMEESGEGNISTELGYWYNTDLNIVGKVNSIKTKYTTGTDIFKSEYTYDNKGNVTSATNSGITTVYEHYEDGNVKKEINAKNIATVYEDYLFGKPSIIKYGADAQGNDPVYQIEQQIDPTGTIASVKNGRGYIETYKYDKINRLVKVTPPPDDYGNVIEQPTKIDYAVDGSTVTITKGNYVIENYFDGLGRNIGSCNGNINVRTKVVYDIMGNKIYNSYPYSSDEHGEYYTYDLLGRKTKVTKPTKSDGTGINTTYNININYKDDENSIEIINEEGNKTKYFYESFGNPDKKRLIQTKNYLTDPQTGNPSEQDATYSYNAVGSLVSINLPGDVRSYAYNTNNQLISEDIPAKGTTYYTYDEIDNLKTKTDSNNLTTTYMYDNLSRVFTVDYSGTGDYDIGYEYDKADNLIKEQNSYSVYISSYNPLNKIIYSSSTIMGTSYITSYKYNKQGLVSQTTYPTGRTINYEYDLGNRIKEVKPYVTDVSYHPSGKISSITFKNNKTQSYAYDDLYRVYTIQSLQVIALTHTYDGRSNLASVTNNISNQSFSFSYDDLDRIIAGNGAWNTGGNAISSLAYSYDSLGNRISKEIAKNNNNEHFEYSYDNKKRLVSYAGAETNTYQYDNVGNITQKGTQQYQLTPAGKIKSASGIAINYAPNNLRTSETSLVGNSAYHSVYHYDLANNLISETDNKGKLIRDYVYLNGMPVARITDKAVDLAIFPENITFSQNPVTITPPTSVTISAMVEDIGGEPNTQDTSVSFYDGYPSTSTLKGNRPISQTGILDQSNQDKKTGQWRVPQQAQNRIYACQSFVPDYTGVLSKVSLYLARLNKGIDLYTLQIKKDEFDSTGHFVSTGTIYTNNMIYSSAATIDVFKWIDIGIGIDKEVMLTKGNKYWIVLYPTMIGWINKGILVWGFNNNKYGPGEAGWGSSETFPWGWGLSALIKDDTKDMMFRAYIMVNEAKFDYTPTSPGVHTIYAWVDPDNTISEIDEKNNLACNYLFTDPTFIQANRRDINALEEFLNGESEADYEK